MTDIVLGSYPPTTAQREVLDAIRGRVGEKGIHRFHAVAGRGGGKTAVGVLAVLESMLTYNRGRAHLWTEQDYPDCRDVFLPVWESFVPPHIYKLNRQTLTITMDARLGGSRLDVRTRFARGASKEKRGPTYAGAVTDEAAQDPQGAPFHLITKMLRDEKAGLRWHLVTTTPKPGWYNEMIRTTEEPVFRWSSWGNEYVSKETFDDFCADMSDEEIRQEMNAELISRSGLVWSEYRDEPHPGGNLHPHTWTPSMPYELWTDIGNRSAWLIVQQVPLSGPWSADGRHIDVIVAEYQPDHGDSLVMVDRISRDYGAPAVVAAGSDVSDTHKSHLTGTPHAALFRSAWPGCRITWPRGSNVSKERQLWHAKSRVAHPRSGARLLCVSQGLVSHDAGRRRGVREMFAADTWPEAGEAGGAALVRKDKARNPQSYEDTRDAVLYGSVCTHPPRTADPMWRLPQGH